MEKKTVILIPSSSKNCNYSGLKKSALIGILYKSLLNFDISKYTFLIGFDNDDEFFLKFKKSIQNKLPTNFHLHYLNNHDKSYVCIVNQLANIAIEQYNADYLFLMADDLIFYDFSFIDKFVDFLKDKPIGLGYPIDKTCTKDICTHPFVSANHVKYLGYFYPKEIKNWYCDTWITRLYQKIGIVCKTDNFVLENKILEKRYDIYNIELELFNRLIKDSEDKIKENI